MSSIVITVSAHVSNATPDQAEAIVEKINSDLDGFGLSVYRYVDNADGSTTMSRHSIDSVTLLGAEDAPETVTDDQGVTDAPVAA